MVTTGDFIIGSLIGGSIGIAIGVLLILAVVRYGERRQERRQQLNSTEATKRLYLGMLADIGKHKS